MPTANRDRPMSPIDHVILIENIRLRLGVKKNEVCQVAGINPEMYSYVLKRGKHGRSLPEDCVQKITDALERIDAKQKKGAKRS